MEELLCRWPGGLSLLVGGSATQHLIQYYPLSHQQPSLLTQFESEHLSYGSESRPSPQGSSCRHLLFTGVCGKLHHPGLRGCGAAVESYRLDVNYLINRLLDAQQTEREGLGTG